MELRIWRVAIVEGQGGALEAFADEVSRPMLEALPGCLGVFFTRSDRECVTVTLWESPEAIATAEAAPAYRDTVAAIEASGTVRDDHRTEVFTVFGGFLEDGLGFRSRR